MAIRLSSEQARLSKARHPLVGMDLESFPCAVALWTPDRLSCVLNGRAKKLLGFLEEDLQKDPSLWISRIHPRDRAKVRTAWKKLIDGEKATTCDFRFTPRNPKKLIALREVSAWCQNPKGVVEAITSVYTDISDLKGHRYNSKEESLPNAGDVVGGLVHEMQNHLQVINLGVELARQGSALPVEYRQVVTSVERAGKSVQELREYFLPPSTRLSKENPGVILQAVIQQMEKELQRQGIRVRVVRPTYLPLVQLDERQFRKMLERVVEFARALLPQGGMLEIKSGIKRFRGRRFVELKVTSSSVTSLGLEEEDVFRPFLRINGYQVGLSIQLAQRILRRHHGLISFQKQTPKKGQFTILLRARPN